MSVPCPNCQKSLSFAALQDGWCESCGKAIPAFVRDDGGDSPKSHEPSRPPAIETNPSAPMTGGQKALAGCFVIGVLAIVVSALMGDEENQGFLIKIGIMFAVALVLGLLGWAIGTLRGKS